ncbi:MAG: hypothetical protein JWN32_495 [Solirubrobacterales bacterium]|nr:hypothetical protein [Solirubrobacterales bacterium]
MSAVRAERSLLDMTPAEIALMFARDAEQRADLVESIAARCEESEPQLARSAMRLAASEREKCATFLLAWAEWLSAPPPHAT